MHQLINKCHVCGEMCIDIKDKNGNYVCIQHDPILNSDPELLKLGQDIEGHIIFSLFSLMKEDDDTVKKLPN